MSVASSSATQRNSTQLNGYCTRMGDGYKITVVGATRALLKAHGNLTQAAVSLKVDRTSLYNFIERNPELNDVRTLAREQLLDVAEGRLAQHIEGGDIRAITFYLKTQGKDRGYTERQEITGKDGAAIEARVSADELRELSAAQLQARLQALLAAGQMSGG